MLHHFGGLAVVGVGGGKVCGGRGVRGSCSGEAICSDFSGSGDFRRGSLPIGRGRGEGGVGGLLRCRGGGESSSRGVGSGLCLSCAGTGRSDRFFRLFELAGEGGLLGRSRCNGLIGSETSLGSRVKSGGEGVVLRFLLGGESRLGGGCRRCTQSGDGTLERGLLRCEGGGGGGSGVLLGLETGRGGSETVIEGFQGGIFCIHSLLKRRNSGGECLDSAVELRHGRFLGVAGLGGGGEALIDFGEFGAGGGQFSGGGFDAFFELRQLAGEFADALLGVGELLLDRGRVGIHFRQLDAGGNVPALDVTVDIAGEDPLAVFAHGDAENHVVRGGNGSDGGAVALPELHCLVPPDRGDGAVRSEINPLHAAGVGVKFLDLGATVHFPEHHGTVFAGGSEDVPVHAPIEVGDGEGVAF